MTSEQTSQLFGIAFLVLNALGLFIISWLRSRSNTAGKQAELALKDRDLELQDKAIELKNAEAVLQVMQTANNRTQALEVKQELQQQQLDKLREENSTTKLEILRRDHESVRRDEQLATLTSRVTSLETERTSLLRTIDEKNAELLAKTAELLARDETIHSLETKLETVQNDLIKARAEIETLSGRVDVIQANGHTGDTDRLNPAIVPKDDPAAEKPAA